MKNTIEQTSQLAADVGDLDTGQACADQLTYHMPISAQLLRLKRSIDQANGRVLSVGIDLRGICIHLQWDSFQEFASSVSGQPTIDACGKHLHATLAIDGIKWTACREMDSDQIRKLLEL